MCERRERVCVCERRERVFVRGESVSERRELDRMSEREYV